MTEKRWERDLADAARGYNEPPQTPRERMWAKIDDARREVRHAEPRPRNAPWWSRRQVLWPAAVVAALAVGLTVGRISVDPGEPAPGALPTVAVEQPVIQESLPADRAVVPATDPTPATYRLAAMPVLQRSETLLLQVRTGDSSSGSFGARAVDLLGQTRLLLASPARDDAELKRLLEDLELALARIVRLAATPRPVVDQDTDRRALENGLERNAVLPRIREQLSTGSAAVSL